MLNPGVTTYIVMLGLCEHCNCLLDTSNMPMDGMGAIWVCPRCGKEISHLSFGFDRSTSDAQKVRWVGPNGSWVDQCPSEDFRLGNLDVLVRAPSSIPYL